MTWLDQGRIDTTGLVTHVSPADPQTVYANIRSRKVKAPFIVYDWAQIGWAGLAQG